MSEKILKYEFELLRFMFEPKSSIRDLEFLFFSYLNLLNNLSLEDQLYIIRLCVSYGSKFKNKKKLFDRLLNNRFDAQYFNFVDFKAVT